MSSLIKTLKNTFLEQQVVMTGEPRKRQGSDSCGGNGEYGFRLKATFIPSDLRKEATNIDKRPMDNDDFSRLSWGSGHSCDFTNEGINLNYREIKALQGLINSFLEKVEKKSKI